MFSNLGLHVIQAPSGRFIYVGTIPTVLGKMVPASDAAVYGQRAFRNDAGEIMEWKFPTFDTQEQAVAHIGEVFVSLGRAGANADTKHPQRAEWENLRAILREFGELA